jgi:uncharacterized protein (DUF362 family)
MGSLAKGTAALASLHPLARTLYAGTDRLEPRVRVPNPYVNTAGHPLLVSVQGTDFADMLATGLSILGGLDRLITNNQTVLIKPNLVTDTEDYPTISSLDSVLSTMQAIQQVSSGQIKVGDGVLTSYYASTGFDPAIPNAGGQLVEFSSFYPVRRSTWLPNVPDFEVFTEVYDAPIIINFCNMKRHNSAYFSCALKSHVGTVNGPGFIGTRDYLHSFDAYTDEFLQTVAEIAGVVNSELHVVDAREIMTVTGPFQSWGGEVCPLHRLILCGDPVATDAYCAWLMSQTDTFDADLIQPTLQRAQELGLGTANLEQVEIHEIDVMSFNPENEAGVLRFDLRQNQPNPFNPTTSLSYELHVSGHVTLNVYNSAGRLVSTLVDGWKAMGTHGVVFDGVGLASGVYFARMVMNGKTKVRKMILAG